VLFAFILVAGVAPVRLASTGFNAVNVPADVATLYGETFVNKLGATGDLVVLTPKDLSALVGLERQRELIGCAESHCVAELAGALGVDGVIRGDVAHLGSSWQLNIRIVSGTGEVLYVFERRLRTEDELLDSLGPAAESARLAIMNRLRPGVIALAVPPSVAAHGPLVLKRWIPAFAGLVAAGVGTGLLLSAKSSYDALGLRGESAISASDALAARNAGKLTQALGITLVSLGAAAIAGSFIWVAIAGARQPVAIVPSGNGVSLVGAW
jgi:hypothetical protein